MVKHKALTAAAKAAKIAASNAIFGHAIIIVGAALVIFAIHYFIVDRRVTFKMKNWRASTVGLPVCSMRAGGGDGEEE